MTPDTPEALEEVVRLALDHAWSWFSLHATQRLQMLNFWLISVAFLTGAFVAAITDEAFGAAFGVAVAGGVASLCFYRLECRTRLLVRLAERAIRKLQSELAVRTGIPELEILSAADTEKAFFTAYGVVIRRLQWLVIFGFMIAALVSGQVWLRS